MGSIFDQDAIALRSMSTLSSGLLQFMWISAASIIIAASGGESGANKTSLIKSGTTGGFKTELPDPKNDFLGLLIPGDEAVGDLKAR